MRKLPLVAVFSLVACVGVVEVGGDAESGGAAGTGGSSPGGGAGVAGGAPAGGGAAAGGGTATGGGGGAAAVGGGAAAGGGGAAAGTVYFISPTGVDSAAGTSSSAPFRTFRRAFGAMSAGDELRLLDGTYSDAAGTGTILSDGFWPTSGSHPSSATPPSGLDRARPTRIRAEHPGQAIVAGVVLGTKTRKDQFVALEGLTMDEGITLFNTAHITIQNIGCHGALSVGSNDHDQGNSDLLVEDTWVWGTDRRILVSVFRADHVVLRRVVFRNDGCVSAVGTRECNDNSGNSMVGSTVYNSSQVSFQNVLALDNRLGNGFRGAGDFYTAWHTNADGAFSNHHWGANDWRGCISLGTELDVGFGYDLDNLGAPLALQPMATWRDVVADAPAPFNAQMNCGAGCVAHDLDLQRGTFIARGGDGVRLGPELAAGRQTVRSLLVLGQGRYGVNSVAAPTEVDLSGTWTQGSWNQAACGTHCAAVDAQATDSLVHVTRVEDGSAVAGLGFTAGATVVRRYGAPGSRWGEADFDVLTEAPLWPWPNQERIRAEMCGAALNDGHQRTDGLCARPSLSHRVWEHLGTPCPDGVCQ